MSHNQQVVAFYSNPEKKGPKQHRERTSWKTHSSGGNRCCHSMVPQWTIVIPKILGRFIQPILNTVFKAVVLTTIQPFHIFRMSNLRYPWFVQYIPVSKNNGYWSTYPRLTQFPFCFYPHFDGSHIWLVWTCLQIICHSDHDPQYSWKNVETITYPPLIKQLLSHERLLVQIWLPGG